MNILALSYLYPNSINPNFGIFVHNRLKAISKHHKICVINPIPWFPFSSKLERYKSFNEIPKSEIIDNVTIYHPRFIVMPLILKFIDTITYYISVKSTIKMLNLSEKFDILDVHWTYPDIYAGWKIGKENKFKTILTLRGKEAFYIGKGAVREAIIKNSIKNYDSVVGLSQELIDLAIEYGVNPNKCHVIRNGVDIDKFYYIDKNVAREKLRIRNDEKIILAVGSLTFRKGFDRIIKSLVCLKNEYKDSKLYIIGDVGPDGDCLKSLQSLIDNLKIYDKVIFVGTVNNSDLVFWYNAADLFCLSSRGEGSPNVLIEALSCGCPSVATDVGGVRDVFIGSVQGVVTGNSYSEFRCGIENALNRQWTRKDISDSMRIYSWDWCATNMMDVYSELNIGL